MEKQTGCCLLTAQQQHYLLVIKTINVICEWFGRHGYRKSSMGILTVALSHRIMMLLKNYPWINICIPYQHLLLPYNV